MLPECNTTVVGARTVAGTVLLEGARGPKGHRWHGEKGEEEEAGEEEEEEEEEASVFLED